MSKKTNIIHDLNPMTSLTFMLCMIVSIFFAGYQYSLICFGILIIISLVARTFKSFMSMLAKTIFILIILMFAMQAVFYPGEEIIWQWKFISIKMEGIMFALSLSAKLLVIGSSIILFFKTTKVSDFISALEQAGSPPALSYVILSTLQLIPQIEKKSMTIMDAQKSRGVETEGNVWIRAKAFIPTLGPLILSSIVGTEERAITLEARAFSAPVKKTQLNVVLDTRKDKVLRIIFIVITVIIIVRGVLLWVL